MKNNFFFCKVKWYSEYEDQVKENSFYAFAFNIVDLGERIEDTFPYIEDVHIKHICSHEENPCFFYVDGLNKESCNLINETNNY